MSSCFTLFHTPAVVRAATMRSLENTRGGGGRDFAHLVDAPPRLAVSRPTSRDRVVRGVRRGPLVHYGKVRRQAIRRALLVESREMLGLGVCNHRAVEHERARREVELVVDDDSVVAQGSISYDLSGPISKSPVPLLPSSCPETRSYM